MTVNPCGLLGGDIERKAAQRPGGTAAMQAFGAGQVEKGLVDRDGLHQGGNVPHHFADIAADTSVFCHVGFDDNRIGAGAQSLEHRHRGMDTVLPRHITGGHHDAAFLAADEHGLVPEGRIVAFLDTCIEGIAIDMGNRQLVELRVGDHAGGTTGRAGGGPEFRAFCKTYPAKISHQETVSRRSGVVNRSLGAIHLMFIRQIVI